MRVCTCGCWWLKHTSVNWINMSQCPPDTLHTLHDLRNVITLFFPCIDFKYSLHLFSFSSAIKQCKTSQMFEIMVMFDDDAYLLSLLSFSWPKKKPYSCLVLKFKLIVLKWTSPLRFCKDESIPLSAGSLLSLWAWPLSSIVHCTPGTTSQTVATSDAYPSIAKWPQTSNPPIIWDLSRDSLSRDTTHWYCRHSPPQLHLSCAHQLSVHLARGRSRASFVCPCRSTPCCGPGISCVCVWQFFAVAFVLCAKTRCCLAPLPAWRQRESRQGNGMSSLIQLWLLPADGVKKNPQKPRKHMATAHCALSYLKKKRQFASWKTR